MSNTQKIQRHELKFYISRGDYKYCQTILSQLMENDQYQKADRGYLVRSLYFDDLRDRAIEEKLAGVELRNKYRLRIYDTKNVWAKLERKAKHGDFVNKSSIIITREEAKDFIKGKRDFLLEKDSKSARSIYFDLMRNYHRPVVLIDYMRDVYKMDYNEIRITFDKHIRASTEDFDIFSDTVETVPFQRDDVIIMEVKFNVALPSWFKDFLKFDSSVHSAISKYCLGRIRNQEYYLS